MFNRQQGRVDKEYIIGLLGDLEQLCGVGITADGVKVNIVDPDTESRTIHITLDILFRIAAGLLMRNIVTLRQ